MKTPKIPKTPSLTPKIPKTPKLPKAPSLTPSVPDVEDVIKLRKKKLKNNSKVRCSAKDFDKVINGIIEDLYEDSMSGMKNAIDKTAKRVVADTKKNAKSTFPVHGDSISGNYAAGWRSTAEKDSSVDYSRIIHNQTPGLPHLLEKGHGGPAPAKAYPHITSDEEVEKILMEELKDEL